MFGPSLAGMEEMVAGYFQQEEQRQRGVGTVHAYRAATGRDREGKGLYALGYGHDLPAETAPPTGTAARDACASQPSGRE